MKSKHFLWLVGGYLVGSYFGLSRVLGIFGSKR